MEKVFERIIEIDRRAKEVYKEAVEEKENLHQELLQDINKRESEINEMAEARVQQMISSGRKDAEDRLDRINRQVREKLAFLDSQAAENARKWEELIFRNVTGD